MKLCFVHASPYVSKAALHARNTHSSLKHYMALYMYFVGV